MKNEHEATILSYHEELAKMLSPSATFEMNMGGTTYEVSARFNPAGRESVLRQFQKMILDAKLN